MDWKLRPARDLGLSRSERLRSHAREVGLGTWILNATWQGLARLYLALFHRFRVTGRENLPAAAPFVLVANHTSHLDTLALASALPGAAAGRAFALAAGDVFFASVPAALFAAYVVNALPIWRRRSRPKDVIALRRRLIEDGLVYILFPEGTRSRDGRMAPFQSGVGALVAGSDVPVVPCRLEGCFAAWPPRRLLPRPSPLRLTIGQPLRFMDAPNDKAGWADIAAACEGAVAALPISADSRHAARSNP